jgi:DnaK suppressor protein
MAVKAKVKEKSKRKLDLKHFESLLHSEHKRLLEERDRIKRNTQYVEGAVPDESWEAEEDSADLSASMMEKEIAISVEDDLEEMIEAVDKALEKVRDKSYGVCDICSGDIAEARLEAIPWATLCINCKSLVENFS